MDGYSHWIVDNRQQHTLEYCFERYPLVSNPRQDAILMLNDLPYFLPSAYQICLLRLDVPSLVTQYSQYVIDICRALWGSCLEGAEDP